MQKCCSSKRWFAGPCGLGQAVSADHTMLESNLAGTSASWHTCDLGSMQRRQLAPVLACALQLLSSTSRQSRWQLLLTVVLPAISGKSHPRIQGMESTTLLLFLLQHSGTTSGVHCLQRLQCLLCQPVCSWRHHWSQLWQLWQTGLWLPCCTIDVTFTVQVFKLVALSRCRGRMHVCFALCLPVRQVLGYGFLVLVMISMWV